MVQENDKRGNLMEKKRDTWSSGVGFVLAAAGSAVGLGNLWKFPYVVGKNGGGAFVLIYLAILFSIGVTMILGEIVIGRAMKKNVYGSYRAVSKRFAHVGIIGVVTGFLILSFYSAVGGWTIKYLLTYVSGGIRGASDQYFNAFTRSDIQTVLFQLIFLVLTAVIVWRGISGGIEKASKIMMPVLFIILIVLVVRSVTLPNAIQGIEFFLKPDFSKVTPSVVLAAMGQVFFSLSVGMGTLITYGSYIDKKQNIAKTSWYIPILDTMVALMGGFAILPAVFSFGFAPSEGPGLAFITIPAIFSKMPLGTLFGFLFFLLLLFAALTSSISMLEVMVSFVTEELHMPRKKAVPLLSGLVVIAAVPCALSTGALAEVKLFGKTVFDLFDFLASNVLMPIGGFLMCIFIGYIWGPKNAIREITNHGTIKFRLGGIWVFLIRYLAPIVVVLILLSSTGILRI